MKYKISYVNSLVKIRRNYYTGFNKNLINKDREKRQ